MSARAEKPLGGKAYGSIPHLPGSRLGPGDWSIHDGQARIACERARDRHDRVIVTEKLDGSCCVVARIDGGLHALTRAGYPAMSSPYIQHHIFASWVSHRRPVFTALLAEGERVCGEWLAQAHGTRYRIDYADQLFVPFDIIGRRGRRAPHDEARDRFSRAHLPAAAVIHDGGPLSIDDALSRLAEGPAQGGGYHGAIDPVEGAVWRVERRGAFDFMAKFVRHQKADGRFLPEISGSAAIWNWAAFAAHPAA